MFGEDEDDDVRVSTTSEEFDKYLKETQKIVRPATCVSAECNRRNHQQLKASLKPESVDLATKTKRSIKTVTSYTVQVEGYEIMTSYS